MPRGPTFWLARSFTVRLVLVVAVFLAVPVVLYQYLQQEHESRQALLLSLVREHSLAISRALEPILTRADAVPYYQLGRELAPYASDVLTLKLLFRPSDPAAGGGFFYVASAPPVSTSDLAVERGLLAKSGVLTHLSGTCEGNLPMALRVDLPDSVAEVITAVTPVLTNRGCWALVLSSRVGPKGVEGLGEPFWRSATVRFAAIIYVLSLVVIGGLVFSMSRSLKGFAALARQIKREQKMTASFAKRNRVPELDEVARDLDGMVSTLGNTAAAIRRNAEDIVHAFKNQIGLIRQSLEPIERRLDPADKRGLQAAAGIQLALERLTDLVQAARQLDRNAADMLDPPRERVNVSDICRGMAQRYAEVASEQGRMLKCDIEKGLFVSGREQGLESIIENVVDNALSFTPPGGTVSVVVRGHHGRMSLVVEDEGPGVAPERLQQIFDRYYTYRPSEGPEAAHFGLGLWLVQQNARALGGDVTAENIAKGGLRVKVELPLIAQVLAVA